MAYVNEINVQGTDYDINDKRLPESSNVIEVQKDLKMGNGKLAKILESITDADGNLRFLEDDLSVETIPGMTSVYAKWSLSGTHLMIVLAGTFEANASISDNSVIATLYLPAWLGAKIYPVQGTLIETKGVNCYRENASYSYQTIYLTLAKQGGTVLDIRNIVGAQTIENNSAFRLQFDLLIDNE